MHHMCPCSRRHPSLSRGYAACQALVKFFALHRIKPLLVWAPVNSFEFHSCKRTPQVGYLTLSAQQSAIVVGVLSDLYTFHAPLEIPSAPTVLQLGGFHRLSKVEPWDLMADLNSHL
ncbi:hypothetical protein GQ457_15G018970 [Hibiscus cannabinus]